MIDPARLATNRRRRRPADFSFDDTIEVVSADGAFSEGGDSGGVIYRREDRAALGLLFAGSSQGGPAAWD